jgi:acyl-CoA synthetase (NDP forming)
MKGTGKPLFLCWSARDVQAKDCYAVLDAARLPHYKSPVRCGRALLAVWSYAEAKRRYRQQREDEAPLIERPNARKLLSGRAGDLAEYEAKRILAEYGIPVTREALATSAKEAVATAQRIGYPVALKVQSPDIAHKTEAKAVEIGVTSDAQVEAAYDEIVANARAYRSDARIDGVLVQEMVAGGTEVILGVTNDPLSGPAVMFGLGGIFAEVLKDVAFRLAPVTPVIAREMIAEIKGHAVLAGVRGKPPADVDALADAIVRLSALAIDLRDHVAELDVNPLFVMERGRGVVAADALIKVRGKPCQ